MTELSVDTSLFRAYSEARRQFLRTLGCNESCRDPLSEFAERLVCQQLGGTLANSRVQKGYDLTTTDGRRVQVKYLANPTGGWRNEHPVIFSDDMDDYAVVFFEGLDVRAILIFQRETLGEVCATLKKRHPNQERVLLLTQANFITLVSRSEEFERFGVRSLPPTWGSRLTSRRVPRLWRRRPPDGGLRRRSTGSAAPNPWHPASTPLSMLIGRWSGPPSLVATLSRKTGDD